MNHPRQCRQAAVILPVWFLLCLLLLGGVEPAAAFGLDPRQQLGPPDPYRPLPRASAREDFSLPLLPREMQLVFEVDTLDQNVVYRAVGRDGSLLGTRLVPLEGALLRRVEAGNSRNLLQSLADGALKAAGTGKDHIEIDIPFKVKSKTFRRIFGSGRIGLNVHGNINLKGTYRSVKQESESASAYANNQNDFRLDQEQQFTVVGKIGEKVDVHIDQNTERSFDFENNLSITYTGEPEEIIEKIEAGNISLALPSTKYVQFSDRSSGLFGLKMVNRFGPLRLTGVASTEKNESKQQTFTGQTSDQNRELGPGNHAVGYFFINEFYRHQCRVYEKVTWNSVTPSPMRIKTFTLFEFNTTDVSKKELNLVDPSGRLVATNYTFIDVWSKGEESKNVSLDEYRGILKLSLSPGKIYAMSYTVENEDALRNWFTDFGEDSTVIAMGDPNVVTGSTVVVLFPQHFNPSAKPWWDLQLRNIFNLGSPGMDPGKFEMSIGKVISGSANQTKQGSDNYLKVLYLDVLNAQNTQGNDDRVDARWIEAETGSIWFPSPRPFAPNDPASWVLNEEFGSTALRDELLTAGFPPRTADLYSGYVRAPNALGSDNGFSRVAAFEDAELDTLYQLRGDYYGQSPDPKWRELNQRFRLISSAKVGTEVISLGWNVTNVVVTANGKRLTQGTDYTLDEQAGLIRITNAAYTTEDQKIQVSYETPQLFQLRKKTFAGVTAELNLWETGNEVSKLGAAYIYFNEETAERKVRLGSEPIKNSVLDVNAKLIFKPRLMTTWMDALPFIEAEQPSSLVFETEYAIVMPDPNPSNNPDTGDNHGVAYVDDFESSKQEIPLSLSHSQWGLSSLPAHELLGLRGWMGWYNPQTKVRSSDIWPNYEESNQDGVSNDVRVLVLKYAPFVLASQAGSNSDGVGGGQPLSRSLGWGGLYYDFRNAYDDLSHKKYIELTLLVEGDPGGRLNLDLGVVSEDVIPDGRLQTEDINDDNILQDGEDVGLDGSRGNDPEWPLADELFSWSGSLDDQVAQLGAFGVTSLETAFDWWDVDGDSLRDPAEPWSMDDWVRLNESSEDVDKSHGSQGNSQDQDQLYADSEDRNANKALDSDNAYFSYSIPLNPADPDYETYISPIENSHWVFVRIPLSDPQLTAQGSPRLDLINGMRIWFTGFREPVTVTLAELNIVGTEWVKSTTEGDTTGFDVSVLNNFDNSEDYTSPPGASGNKDLVTGVPAREQALVVELQDLPYGRTAWVSKTLDMPANLSEYRELKMFAHGGVGKTEEDSLAYLREYGTDKLEYHLRLQSTPGNYYEYSKPLHAGWNPLNNNMHIILAQITAIDQFTGAQRDHEEPDKPLVLPDGGQLRVVGNPTITRITTMLLGVTNHGYTPARTEVWFNELRVSNVKKKNSRAMRADLTAKFSDVLTVNTNYDQQDADYHTVKERTPSSPTYKENFSASADMDLGRLLPPSLGVSAKLAVNTAQRLNVPKFYPNDDQEVDLLHRPQEVETYSRSQGATLNLKKSNSQAGWAKETLDKVTFSTDLSNAISRNNTVAADTLFNQGVRFGYNNTFRWTHTLKPLAFVKGWPLVGKSSALEIGYFPENFGLGASTSRKIQHTWRRDLSHTSSETYTLSRNWSTSFKPLKTLSFNVQRSYNNNLRFRRNQARVPDALSISHPNHQASLDFISRLEAWQDQERDLHDGDHDVNQTVGFNWGPKLVDWSTSTFSYNTSYRWSRELTDPSRGVNVSNNGKFTAELKPDLGKLTRKLLWMNEDKLNAAKKELGDAAGARTKKRQDKADARKKEREAKAAAKLVKKGKPGATAEALGSPEGMTPDSTGTANPALIPPPPVDGTGTKGAPANPKPQRGKTARKGDKPDGLDGKPEDKTPTPPVIQPLRPMPGDSLLQGLPDSLRNQLALADSLIRQAAGQPGSDSLRTPPAGAKPTLGSPDSLAADSSARKERWAGFRVLGAFFGGIWKRAGVATTMVEPIDVRFSRDAGRTDPAQAVRPWTPLSQRHADLGYQLALSPTTGLDTTRVNGGLFTNQRNFGYSYSLGTKLNLHKELPLRLSYEYAFSQQFSNEEESSRSENQTGWYLFENDPLLGKGTKGEGDVVGANPGLKRIPNYSFSLRKLNRLPFLSKPFKDLNLTHDYKGKQEIGYSLGSNGIYRSSLRYSRDFSPLAGLDFQLDKGWSGAATYKHTRTLSISDPDRERSVTLRQSRGWTVSAQKALKNGFKLPGFKQRFKNDTTLKLTYDYSVDLDLKTMRSTEAEGAGLVWNTPIEKRNWGLTLSTDYAFSRNVKGGGSLKYGVERSSQANDMKKYLEFQLTCRIEVRSK